MPIMNDQTTYKRKHWLLTLFTVAAVVWGAVACQEEDLNRTFEGPYFVRFTDSTLTYKESYSKPIVVRVHNAGPQLSQPIIVKYTVSGTAREGKDYALVGTKGTVVIPANKSFGEIPVKLINNANNILESQSLTFTLTSVEPSSLQVGFGQEGALGKQLTLLIQDDCLFGGFYSGSARVGTQTYTTSDVEITSTDCKTYRLSNWNLGIFGFAAIKSPLSFTDNGDNTLTIQPQSSADLGDNDTLRGNGAWNPRDKKITLNIQAKIRITTVRDTVRTFRDTTLLFTQTYTPQ